MIIQKVLSLKQQAPSCQKIFLGNSFLFRTRYLLTGVTECGPNLGNHSKPSLKTEEIMLLYSRLKVYGMRMEMIFWLTVSTNGVLTRILHFLVQVWVCLILIGGKKSSEMNMEFFSHSCGSFFAKQCVPSPPSSIIVGFLPLKGILRTWGQPLRFLQLYNLEFL